MDMRKIPLENRAVALPLLGLVIAWALFMGAAYADLYNSNAYYYGENPPPETFKISVYLNFLGITVGSLASLFGQTWAIKARHALGEDHKMARAAHRFTNLAVIISLAIGAIFAISTFLSSFNSYYGQGSDVFIHFLNVYLPIFLATALVITVLLRAFVFRVDTIETNEEGKPKMSEAQKALGLGYAVPILAAAFAMIFGLVVYQVTRTDLQVWVWVIIQLIIALGIIAGTRFSSKARLAKTAEAPKPRKALAAAGAANLNFVLSIVFGAVVSVMAFTFGQMAIQKLQVWPEVPVDCKDEECNVQPGLAEPSIQWLFEDLLPAKVLLVLAVVGIYLTITERNREKKQA
jgi:hypothetical protein